MESLQKICEISDLKENFLNEFEVNEKKIIVLKKDSKIFILDGICLHKGAPLCKGILKEKFIQCPWHGCLWNIENGENEHNSMKLKTYKPKIINKKLYI